MQSTHRIFFPCQRREVEKGFISLVYYFYDLAFTLKHYKPIKTKENIVKITAEHLKVEVLYYLNINKTLCQFFIQSLDVLSSVHFLAWQQVGGSLQKELSSNALNNFTQKDVDDGNVYFKLGNREEVFEFLNF